MTAAQRVSERRRDLSRIRRLFTPSDEEFSRLSLIARLEAETRLFAGPVDRPGA